jgi:hypothetical protein
MKTKIDERKNIIVSLKSNYGVPNKGIEKRIQYLKIMTILDSTFTVFFGGFLVFSILSEFFGFEFIKWQKMAFIVILLLSFIIRFPNNIYELKLLKHFKKINPNSEFNGMDKLNNDLKSIIKNLNNRKIDNWIVGILVIGIFIMGIWQMGFDNNNPYWNYMKLPFIAFFGIVVIRFIVINKKLTENISETEKHFI